MKDAIRGIVGKTVESVVISEDNKKGPTDQIFLVFTDRSYFEIYGDLALTGGIDSGGEAEALIYAKLFAGKITIHSADRDNQSGFSNEVAETTTQSSAISPKPRDEKQPE